MTPKPGPLTRGVIHIEQFHCLATNRLTLHLSRFVRVLISSYGCFAQAAYALPSARSVFAMAPKRKLLCDLGSVQFRSGQWRAAVWLDGNMAYGPTRYQESAAQADLQLARAASSKKDMAVLLHQLKQGMSSAREHVAHEMQELEKSRVDNAKITEELTAKNDRLEIQIGALLKTNANQKLEISGLQNRVGALQKTNANQQMEIGGLEHRRKRLKTECEMLQNYIAELEVKLGYIKVSPKFVINSFRTALAPERGSEIEKLA